MKNSLFFLALLIFVLSCKDSNQNKKNDTNNIGISEFVELAQEYQKVEVISENTQNLGKLSTLITNTRFLPLETPEGVLIGNINKLFIIDNLMYIADMSYTETLFVFDNLGKFKFLIKSDKVNPNGFREFSAIAVTSKRIYISDQSKLKLFIYDTNGKFIETKNLEYYFNNFVCVNDESLYLLTGTVNNVGQLNDIEVNKNLVHVDLKNNFAIKNAYFEHSQFRDVDVKIKSFSRTNDGSYLLTPFFDSNLYELSAKGVKIKYSIDFDGKKMSQEELSQIKSSSELTKLFVSNPKTIGIIDNLIENKNWLRFSYQTNFEKYGSAIKSSAPNIFFNKNTKEIFKIDNLFKSNDLNDYVQYKFYNINSNNELISSIPAEEVAEKNKEKVNELNNVTAGDNPVLVFYKLKS